MTDMIRQVLVICLLTIPFHYTAAGEEDAETATGACSATKAYAQQDDDIVLRGDFPVVWTNTRYRMIYLNMGHGDEGFIDATQNLLFTSAFRWVVSKDRKGNPFEK